MNSCASFVLVHTIPSSAGISGRQSPRAFCASLWAGPWIFFISTCFHPWHLPRAFRAPGLGRLSG